MDRLDKNIWRIVDLLKWSRGYLADKGVESPQIEAEWMLRHVLNLSRLEIYLQHERPLNADELAQFKTLIIRRSQGIPVQYVLGYTEFMDLTFIVNPDVLIPRPETELLVEKTLELLKYLKSSDSSVLDVGTGSGCIAVSIAAVCNNCRVTALDVSPAALNIAGKNAENNGVFSRISFIEMDILHQAPAQKTFNIIASNPPYVAADYWENLPPLVKENEPRLALYPGDDGLLFYRRLTALSQTRLANGGYLIVEIGGTYQEADVCRIFKESGLNTLEVIKDYSGESRVVVGTRNS